MADKVFDCFISYASPDLALAEGLHAHLLNAGLNVWFDKVRLRPGFDWHKEIEHACEASRVMLPVLTPRWQRSEWTKFETHGHDAIIPLICDGAPDEVMTPPLRGRQAHRLSLTTADDSEWKELVASVRALLAVPAPDRPERIANLRYVHNEYFVGRETELLTLHEELHQEPTAVLSQGRVLALSALGGVGKTTLASEYAHKFWRLYAQMFWVDGRIGYEAEFARIYDVLHPDSGNLELKQKDKAIRALQELSARTERLLILDNVEDELSVQAWIPKSGGCRTLITSRFAGWSAAVRSIHLDVLQPEASRNLLLGRTGREATGAEHEACDALAKELGYLPLALEQAASYMVEEGSAFSFADSLRLYRRTAKELLAAGALGSTEYPDSMITTWKATIVKLSPESRAILRISSCLAATPIPLTVFVQGADRVRELAGEFGTMEPVEGDEEIEMHIRSAAKGLKRYSMVRYDGEELQFHNLVQTVERLNAGKGQAAAVSAAVDILNAAFPNAEFKNWPLCTRLTPHAEAIASRAPDTANVSLERLLSESGLYLYTQAEWLRAELLFQCALRIGEASYGPDHPRVATHLNNLALLVQDTNRLAEAESLLRRALEIDEANYGPDHLNVARLSNLARVLQATNRLAEAEPLLRRALKIDEANYGPDHPDVARCLNNLAVLLTNTNRLAEAEPLVWRALKIDEASYGPDHPDVAKNLNNLALLLRNTNRLAEAEPLLRRALKIDEASYGPDHPDVARDLNSLATVLRETKRLAEAEPFYRRALKIDEASYGPDHPQVGIVLGNLAALLGETNRLAEGIPLIRRAATIFLAALGPEHPTTKAAQRTLLTMLKLAPGKTPFRGLFQKCIKMVRSWLPELRDAVNRALRTIISKRAESAMSRLANASSLQGLLILINRDDFDCDDLKDQILNKMGARGRLYKEWLTPLTPVKVVFVPGAENPGVFMANALVQFREMLGDEAALERIEVANFQATEGVRGVILTHWRSETA